MAIVVQWLKCMVKTIQLKDNNIEANKDSIFLKNYVNDNFISMVEVYNYNQLTNRQ